MTSQKSMTIWSATTMNSFATMSSGVSTEVIFAPASEIIPLASVENEGDRPRGLHQVGNPILLEAHRRVRARDVVDDQGALRPLERAFLDPLVPLLPEDVPDHERQVGRP